MSVFPYPKEKPASAKEAGVQVKKQSLPITVISDGVLLEKNLQKAKKDGSWMQKQLRQRDATVEQTWLLTVDGEDNVVFYRKEER